MKIATILFTYNRSKHTKQVLDALSRNTILPDKLYIFQDGPKKTTDIEEWATVSNVINEVSWCDTEITISDKNKGLANSIKTGVNKVLHSYDAVIVLEDDCVPHPQFMEYMIKALNKYESYKEVYHIGASSVPVDVEGNGADAYFMGRINSYGWGTWKDRWEQFSNDYTMIAQIKNDEQLYEWFRIWGEDLEGHVLGNVEGRTDSWAAFWALTVIMKKGYCLAPYESLIKNIGFDNTGVHSGMAQPIFKIRSEEKRTEIVLPDKIELVENYKISFENFCRYTNPAVRNGYYKDVALDLLEISQKKLSIADYLNKKEIRTVAIWGRGRISDYIINELEEKIEVSAIVETHPTGHEYRGIPLMTWEMLPDEISLIIIIPGFDVIRIKNMMADTVAVDKVITIDRLAEAMLEFAVQNREGNEDGKS